ncbi:MAG: S41 family peptidase [Clostridiales bacterium]|nr:S41 family peptidase [Clostridiales bacterium]
MKKNRDFKRGVAVGIAAALLVAAGACAGVWLFLFSGGSVLTPGAMLKLLSLEQMIDDYYLGEKNEEDLTESLYAGLIDGLGDIYSRYYTAEEYEEESASTEGTYVGIGVTLSENTDGGVVIVECYEGGPGDLAGLEAGDVISAMDGTDILDMELSDVVSLIKSTEADSVVLTVHRDGVEEPMEIEVSITDVELTSVYYEMLDEETGYLQITEFTGVTCEQYESAFEDLESQGMTRLVVDLRDNPGGLLDSVCNVLRRILPEGVIVYTEDKNGNRVDYTCDGENTLDIPLAVLVNGGSASASEIFAGAVQDYGIGTIVGTTTYGKGVVQSIRRLSDGSAVKLTVANYYTPNGNNINQVGIRPDVEVELDTDLLGQEEISHEEDNQLQTALEVLGQ